MEKFLQGLEMKKVLYKLKTDCLQRRSRPMQKKNRLCTDIMQGRCRKRTGGCRGYSGEGAPDYGSKTKGGDVVLSATVQPFSPASTAQRKAPREKGTKPAGPLPHYAAFSMSDFRIAFAVRPVHLL